MSTTAIPQPRIHIGKQENLKVMMFSYFYFFLIFLIWDIHKELIFKRGNFQQIIFVQEAECLESSLDCLFIQKFI